MSTSVPPEQGLRPEMLERGELVFLPRAPFALAEGDDLGFLLQQQAASPRQKHICFNPHTGQLGGFARCGAEQETRLSRLLSDFSRGVTGWLAQALPDYRGGIEPDRATLRPEEEATRRLRPHARNDLLHVDAFPGRPARGRRILRVYANIHPTEDRIWATSEPLPRLLARYGDRVKRSRAGWFHEVGARLAGMFGAAVCSDADLFMLRLHDYLKSDLDFQQRGLRRLWRFPPGSAWLAMTDACTHAQLRGRYALEHSFFIAADVLACPELAPARLVLAG